MQLGYHKCDSADVTTNKTPRVYFRTTPIDDGKYRIVTVALGIRHSKDLQPAHCMNEKFHWQGNCRLIRLEPKIRIQKQRQARNSNTTVLSFWGALFTITLIEGPYV